MMEEDDEIIYELDEDGIAITREEAKALIKEFKNTYISYENPIAVQVMNRIMRFVDGLD